VDGRANSGSGHLRPEDRKKCSSRNCRGDQRFEPEKSQKKEGSGHELGPPRKSQTIGGPVVVPTRARRLGQRVPGRGLPR
jgi:hypothetical protein